MVINLDNLDIVTQEKYREFKEQVSGLLANYQENDRQRFELVKRKIEQSNGKWDTTFSLESQGKSENVDITQLLAYEYCLATERITFGKVSFEEMLEKLFNGVKKFKIGNPVPGIDDECLYGKAVDDETAVPVTSIKYRIIMHAGAQHLEYYINNELSGAVFLYKKDLIKGGAHDENGRPVDIKIDGIDFENLGNEKQSLLTNFRQTAFHEWTHRSEMDVVDVEQEPIPYEYIGADGKKYRNFHKVDSYVELNSSSTIQEPEYIFGTIDGNKGYYYIDENGNKRAIENYTFDMQKISLEKEIGFSQGLETRVVLPDGTIEMHNIVTEGFVEGTSRAMVRAIDPNVKDIDEGKYPEHTNMAYKVILSRDASLGENGQGQTYADFLTHSTVLKVDLESRVVSLPNGHVDGLHYISDYANKASNKETPRREFLKRMDEITAKFKLDNSQLTNLQQSNLWLLTELSQEQLLEMKSLMMASEEADEAYVDSVLQEYLMLLAEEKRFFDGIPEKLGYETRVKSVEELALEILPILDDISLLRNIGNKENSRGHSKPNILTIDE